MIQFFSNIFRQHKRCAPLDWVGPICMLLLGLSGVNAIYGAECAIGGNRWWIQLIWLGLGGLFYWIVASIDYKVWMEKAHLVFGCSIILLLLLWTPLGLRYHGCLRWIDLKLFAFQPSEAAKIGVLILGSSVLARSRMGSLKDSLLTLVAFGGVFAVPALLIFLQPDLGSALIFPPVAFALLYVARLSSRFFLVALGVFIVLLGVLGWDNYMYCKFLEENDLSPIQNAGVYEAQSWVPLKDYQRNRILAFVAPEVLDPQGVGIGWNLRQSLIAVGTGGLLGKGTESSTQTQLGYLPQSVASNDFIFSVWAEQKGFLGGLGVIVLLGILVCNGIRIACLSRDRFGAFLCVGASVIIGVHAFINIGMTIGIMPITGLPLPFISYGGSFVLTCAFLQGLVQSTYRFRRSL
jgi:rod shape determining protein RodA